VIALVAALVPAALLPYWFFYFEAIPKTAILLAGTGVLLLRPRRLEPGIRRLSGSTIGRAFLALSALTILSQLISAGFSGHFALAFFGSGWRRLGAIEWIAIVLFCLLAGVKIANTQAKAPAPRSEIDSLQAGVGQAFSLPDNSRGLITLLRAICLSGTAVGAYAIAQYFGWDPLIDPQSYRVAFNNLSIVRPPGSIGHATYLASYLLLVTGAASSLAACDRSWPGRTAACAAVAAAVAALVVSGTRAGLLGLGIGAVFFAARTGRRAAMRVATVAALLAAVLSTLYFTPLGDRLRDRIVQWSSDSQGGPRLLLWRDSLAMARNRLALGAGPETFATEFPKYQSAELARAYPDFYHESPHNICLDALLSQGLPGLALLLGFFALGVGASFRCVDRTVSAGLASGLIGAFVSQQFTPFVLSTALLFYLTIAMLAALAVGNGPSDSVPSIGMRPLAATVGALLLLIAGQLVHIDWRWASLRRSLDTGKVEQAMAQYTVIQRLYPPQPGPDVWYSRALLEAAKNSPGDTLHKQAASQALTAAIRAGEVSDDRLNALYNLAVLYSTNSDLPHAEAASRAAIEIAPRWYKPHWLLAELLLAQNRPQPAEQEALKAQDYSGRKALEVTDTLNRIRAAAEKPK
jgi:O-antigen ligase